MDSKSSTLPPMSRGGGGVDQQKLKNKLKADKRKQREKEKKKQNSTGAGGGVVGSNNKDGSDSDDNDNDIENSNSNSNSKSNRNRIEIVANESKEGNGSNSNSNHNNFNHHGVEIEYVSPDMDAILDSSIEDPALRQQFKEIFSKFAKLEELVASKPSLSTSAAEEVKSSESEALTANAEEESAGEKQLKLSNKKKKLLTRLSVAELKTLVPRPEIVEAHDVASTNPRLLVYLKSCRNTVPVPRHWCAKRKYLQGKRGIDKPPFKLPDFIADTGITKIRDSLLEREALKNSKQKARDRLQVKNGKLDIDYQVLHDAFFKFQTIPKLTIHGDIYYEGKEFEKAGKDYVPGVLSDALKEALGIVDGQLAPPPWLINMQRYGPPPSYPMVKIPGLNAPLPSGAMYGFHAGGWGKPPVDEYGQPLYGDVFGISEGSSDELSLVYSNSTSSSSSSSAAAVDKKALFGQMNQTIVDSDESDDDAGVDGDDEDAPTIINKKFGSIGGGGNDISGLETPSSVFGGLETPNVVDIRKRLGTETPDPYNNSSNIVSRDLYTVLGERTVSGSSAAGQFFKSDRSYVIPGMEFKSDEGETAASAFADGTISGFDSQMVKGKAEDAAQKRKRTDDSSSSSSKKLKDFKF